MDSWRVVAFIGMLVVYPVQALELVIGTGSLTGLYNEAGRVICRVLDRQLEETQCRTLPSAGSLSNLDNVQVGSLDLGLVQSDVQYHAVNRSGPFEFVDRDYSNVRSLFSLYTEPFTLVARRDAGIERLDDLPGKRVNIGNTGSGQRATMELVMQAKGWSRGDFQLVTELPASQQSMALCHDRVQAMVYTVGHPNRSVAKAVELCDGHLVSLSDSAVDNLVNSSPYYVAASIPAGTYEGVFEPIETFGVLATLVSSSDVDDDIIYSVVRSLFENFDTFSRMHLVFGDLEPEIMIRDGLAAPLHEGAARYYRERGWLQ